jgi:hypothetical protein
MVKKPSKYRAKITEIDGIKFHSRKEARYYCQLKIMVLANEVLYFLRQVPIYLPGNVKYVVDFVEFHVDGCVKYVDVKGFRTRSFIDKKKIVESLYPIKIEVI